MDLNQFFECDIEIKSNVNKLGKLTILFIVLLRYATLKAGLQVRAMKAHFHCPLLISITFYFLYEMEFFEIS